MININFNSVLFDEDATKSYSVSGGASGQNATLKASIQNGDSEGSEGNRKNRFPVFGF